MQLKRKYPLEGITRDYWDVSHVLRSPHSTKNYTAQEALRKLGHSDLLRPDTDWRLIDLMHVIKFDIIEGNQEWRGKQQVQNSASILHMKDWISTGISKRGNKVEKKAIQS